MNKRLPKITAQKRQPVYIYLSEPERNKIKSQAAKYNKSVSSYCANLISTRSQIVSETDLSELKNILKDIRKDLAHFSGYANQIAKATNINKEFSEELLDDWKQYRSAALNIAKFFNQFK
jgi:uncharacterized membrane protein YdfJ with MMPL/SSD domain